MFTYFLDESEVLFEFEPLNPEALPLSSEQIDQSLDYCRSILDDRKQWQTYLNSLAFFGFQNWLEQRSSELIFNLEHPSVEKPELAYFIEAVCNLAVNQFKICLVALGNYRTDTIILPRAIFELPEYRAHYYILIEVQEELETTSIYGFISYSDFQAHKTQIDLEPKADWTYSVPLSWFNTEPDQFLLFVRCLEVSAIPLPEIPNPAILLSQIREELISKLSQLQSSEPGIFTELWQILTWEQGKILFSYPELLRWIYEVQNQVSLSVQPISQSYQNPVAYLADLFNLLTQPALNLAGWFNPELDIISTALSWVFIPDFSPETALRDGTAISSLVKQLQENGVEISPQAKGAYRDLGLGGRSLRLYALTWPLEWEIEPEWTLLLILGLPTGTDLPVGVKLRVSDATGILVEQDSNREDQCSYLFTRVVGTCQEKFVVTVSLREDITETLPPFEFSFN